MYGQVLLQKNKAMEDIDLPKETEGKLCFGELEVNIPDQDHSCMHLIYFFSEGGHLFVEDEPAVIALTEDLMRLPNPWQLGNG